MNKNDKIYVAGHTGMVGAALVNQLRKRGFENIITRSRSDLDLLDYNAVKLFFEQEKPQYVFFAAGKQGGIYANNTYRADFIYENMTMQGNVIHASFLHEVYKLMFFACSAIYPKHCLQPMKEEYILSGIMEPTNEPFAIAKIAGLKMCEAYNQQYGTDFITVIPTNLYGPNQKYELMNSLVVPALILKIHEAKIKEEDEVKIWGSGHQVRDFLYVNDLAEACLFLMEKYQGNDFFNIATGSGHTIAELAEIIQRNIGYKGKITYDHTKPEGVLEKLSDVSKINAIGWKYRTQLEVGIHLTYQDFLSRNEGN